jgi:hypothetical protein
MGTMLGRVYEVCGAGVPRRFAARRPRRRKAKIKQAFPRFELSRKGKICAVISEGASMPWG